MCKKSEKSEKKLTRKCSDVILYTNSIFFFGAFMAFYWQKFWHGSLISVVSVTSSMHHYYYEVHPYWAVIDWCVGFIIVCYNLTQLKHFLEVYQLWGFGWYCLTIWLYIKARDERRMNGIESYDYWHKFWHISGGLGICLVSWL